MAVEQYLEDLAVGQRFYSRRQVIDADAIRRFASEFDPQPFHLDAEAGARHPVFRGLAASGWHTAGITMRLLVDSDFSPAGGLIGATLEELTWPRPTRAGDELRLEVEVLELRPSRTRPERGMIKVRVTTFNQHDEVVQNYVGHLTINRRPTAP